MLALRREASELCHEGTKLATLAVSCTLPCSLYTPITFSPLDPSLIPLSLSCTSIALLSLTSALLPSLHPFTLFTPFTPFTSFTPFTPSLSSLPSPYPRFHGGHCRSAGEEKGNAAVLRVEEEAVERSVDRSLTQTALHNPTMAPLNCSVCSFCVSSRYGGVRGGAGAKEQTGGRGRRDEDRDNHKTTVKI